MAGLAISTIKVADEAWIALATLLRQNPDRTAFTSGEILAEVRRQALHPGLRPGVQTHISHHNVANIQPSSARYRMFFRLPDGTYRLYRAGDPTHPERTGKTRPRDQDLHVEFHSLIDWYDSEYNAGAPRAETLLRQHPMFKLCGLGKHLWATGETPDEHVARLRSGWYTTETPVDPQPSLNDADEVWGRVVKRAGEEFRTASGLLLTYEVDGNGLWFYRDGKKINMRLSRNEFEKGLARCPLHSVGDLKKLFDYPYLYALLTDARIIGRD
jgi:hypothetical protein